MRKIYCDCCTMELHDKVPSTVEISYLGVLEINIELCKSCYEYGVPVMKRVLYDKYLEATKVFNKKDSQS
jgi:hypothetical protein